MVSDFTERSLYPQVSVANEIMTRYTSRLSFLRHAVAKSVGAVPVDDTPRRYINSEVCCVISCSLEFWRRAEMSKPLGNRQ